MKSWQSTLGGAFTALGTALMGVGIVPQLNGVHDKVLTWITLAGFICNGLGAFFGHLFAADQKTMLALMDRGGIDTSPIAKIDPYTQTK